MLVPREWNDVPELHEAIAEALWADEDGGMEVQSDDCMDSYGNDGTVQVRLGDRTFKLSLHEVMY